MNHTRLFAAVGLIGLCALPVTCWAQEESHTVDSAELHAAVVQRAEREAADRDAIARLLSNGNVRKIAEANGLSIQQARTAARTLHGEELRSLAELARSLDRNLSGGAATITLSETAIIIILLVLIIIIVA